MKSKILEGFGRWLKNVYRNGKFKSTSTYMHSMNLAIEDLCISLHEFEKWCKPSILVILKLKLMESKRFLSRSEKHRSDILSAFEAFIKYHFAIAK